MNYYQLEMMLRSKIIDKKFSIASMIVLILFIFTIIGVMIAHSLLLSPSIALIVILILDIFVALWQLIIFGIRLIKTNREITMIQVTLDNYWEMKGLHKMI